jgi:DNA-binding IclR family transcriptional regulator
MTSGDHPAHEIQPDQRGSIGRRRDGGCGPSDAGGPAEHTYSDLQGVGRAFAILERLAERPMRASELARVMEIKWTTAHRTLAYLESMGYIERDAVRGEYFVGVRAYSLGSSYVASLRLSETARPYLKAAALRSGETVQLVKRDHRQSVVLAVHDGVKKHVPETTVGCNFPLHCGSKGHVLLAHSPERFLDDYLAQALMALTPHTLTDPDRLRARLDEVRHQGFAATSRDVRMFSASVAAPVYDRAGRVVASVTVVGTPADVADRLDWLSRVVVHTAQSVTRGLAHTAVPVAG